MKNSVLLLLFLFVAVSLLGAATAKAECDTRRCTGNIDQLYMDDEKLHVEMAGDPTKLSCTPVDDRYITVSMSNPAFREWHGMLLGAFLGGWKVFVRATNSGECKIKYLIMDRTTK